VNLNDQQLLATHLVRSIEEARLRGSLPMAIRRGGDVKWEELPDAQSHSHVWSLRTGDQWRRLTERFAPGVHGASLRPWYRCMGVLRGLDAQSVLLEPYYVCLDYRSEFASFYAHVDAPRRSYTSRLHFFACDFKDVNVDKLEDIESSYLGYIVIREGDLPLVARALISTPSYIKQSSEIEEFVNVFGSRLLVRGVPFMQQDERFARCSHVAAWVMQYCAYRRGVSERRFIADIVGAANAVIPLRPTPSDGLDLAAVPDILRSFGLQSHSIRVPNIDDTHPGFPPIRANEVWDLLSDDLRSYVAYIVGSAQETDLRKANISVLIERGMANAEALAYIANSPSVPDESHSQEAEPGAPSEDVETSPQSPHSPHSNEPEDMTTREAAEAAARDVNGLIDAVLDYMIGSYVASGWPVMLATRNHALVACGRSVVHGKVKYFVHDDQLGPYILLDSLVSHSRALLRYQCGLQLSVDSPTPLRAPRRDVVAEILDGTTKIPQRESDSHVHAMVFATPRRLLHDLYLATRAAQTLISSATVALPPERAAASSLAADRLRTRTLMAIDYKLVRIQERVAVGDTVAASGLRGLQLAEWVSVVEGVVDEDGKELSQWELVFDGSSGGGNPRLQFARFGQCALVVYPKTQTVEKFMFADPLVPILHIPNRVAKVHSRRSGSYLGD
jgi:hypothetical protein